jgi:hypothetical protein
MNGSVVWHTEDAMISVKVLVQRELENRRAPMAGNDNRPSKEEGPSTEPALAILGNYLFAVGEPIVIPVEDRGRIVNAEDVYILHFKASCLEVAYHPAQRSTCIGTRENILVHEKTPARIREYIQWKWMVTPTRSSPRTATRAVDRPPGRRRRHRRQGDRTPDEGRHRSGEHQHATRDCKHIEAGDTDN